MGEITESGSVTVGGKAPDFTLPSSGGGDIRLSSFRGKVVVLYFYPKDFTPGCTAEACGFRDDYQAFKDAGAEVIGVSADSVSSHEGFAAKHGLPFILVSDVDGAVRRAYGAAPEWGILPKRVTFIIDKDGKVSAIFATTLGAAVHVDVALRLVRELTA